MNNPSALIFIDQYNSSPYTKKHTCKRISGFGEKFNEFFQTGMDRGFVKPMAYNLIASVVFGCIITTAKFHLSGRHDYSDAEMLKIATVIWDGIKVQD